MYVLTQANLVREVYKFWRRYLYPYPPPKCITVLIAFMLASKLYILKGEFLFKYQIDLVSANNLFQIMVDPTAATAQNVRSIVFRKPDGGYANRTLEASPDPMYPNGMTFAQAIARADRMRDPTLNLVDNETTIPTPTFHADHAAALPADLAAAGLNNEAPPIPTAFFAFLYTRANDSSDEDIELPDAAADGTDFSRRDGVEPPRLSNQSVRLLQRRTSWTGSTSTHTEHNTHNTNTY